MPTGLVITGAIVRRGKRYIGDDKKTVKVTYELDTQQGAMRLSQFPEKDEELFGIGEVVSVGVRISTFTNRRGFALYECVVDNGKAGGGLGEEF